jgi:hypothetical protein
MSQRKRQYGANGCKPSLHTCFKKEQCGNLTDEEEAALLKELNPDPPTRLKNPLRARDMHMAAGPLLP